MIAAAIVSVAFAGLPAAHAVVPLTTFIVGYDDPPTSHDLDTLAGVGLGIHGFRHVPAAVVVALPTAKRTIARLPGVRGVFENESFDLLLRQSTRTIRADAAWDLGVTGTGVGVAVIDAGVDGTHPDLCAAPELCSATPVKTVQNVKILGRQDLADPVVVLEDQLSTDSSSGHGTHVAGIVGGYGKQSAYEADKYAGVAPGADIVGLGTGEAVEAVNVLAAYDWAIDHRDEYNIRVINNSWGPGKGTPYDAEHPVNLATDAAWDAGISVVFGAGNDGPTTDTMNMFSTHPRAISAAGGTKGGHIAFFSSRGVPGSELWHPTVTAPGYNIVSTRATTGFVGWVADATSANPDMPVPPDDVWYATSSGTSMAAPHVSGVVALMQQAAHDARGVWLTPQEVRDLLQNTAVGLDAARGPGGLPNYQAYTMGAGYMDAAAAVEAAAAGTHTEAYDDGITYDVRAFSGEIGPAAIVPTTTFNSTIEVAPGAVSLDVMADWTVPANDVDIDLFRPDGTLAASTFLRCDPNAEPNGYSSFCTSIPNERVTISAPAAGTWRATIKGSFSATETVRGVWSVAYPDGAAPASVTPASVTVAAVVSASVTGVGVDVAATVRDASGRAVPNAVVSWSAAGVGEVTHAETVTHADGTARAIAMSDLPGTQTVTAVAGGISGSVSITWLGVVLVDPLAPSSTPGEASGGGWIPKAGGGKHTFGFWGEYRTAADGPAGELSFNEQSGTKVKAEAVSSFVRDGNRATIMGTASVDGISGYRFTLEVVDNGTPGKDADTFRLVVSNPADPFFTYERSGTLGGGNLTVRP